MAHQRQLSDTLDASIETHAFSGVVSIRLHGQPLYERAAGYADRSNRISKLARHPLRHCLGTKFLTALAIGKLIAAGKLSSRQNCRTALVLDFPGVFTRDHHSPLAHAHLGNTGLLR